MRDAQLCHDMCRVWEESDRNDGARKVLKQLGREPIPAVRCSVERLMKRLGLEGVTAWQALYDNDTG